jgi:hypothetical protein
VRAVPRLCELHPGICLTTEEKHEKTSVSVVEKCPDIPVAFVQYTFTQTIHGTTLTATEGLEDLCNLQHSEFHVISISCDFWFYSRYSCLVSGPLVSFSILFSPLSFYSSRPRWPSGLRCGLRPLASWDCGFESRQGHGSLSYECCVCCQVKVSAAGRSLVQMSPTECVRACVRACVIECDQLRAALHLQWIERKTFYALSLACIAQ